MHPLFSRPAGACAGVLSAVLLTCPAWGANLQLDVDASHVAGRILRAHETIPVTGTHVVQYYPQWRPGDHAPLNRVTQLTDLVITANGQPIPWRCNLEDAFTFVQTSTLDALIDAPALAGLYMQTIDLTPGSATAHSMVVAEESPGDLPAPGQLVNYTRLVAEAKAMFRAEQFTSYQFLGAANTAVPPASCCPTTSSRPKRICCGCTKM